MTNSLLPTEAEITAAKMQCLKERTALRLMGIQVKEDELELGLRLANAITTACYGPKGEKRN